MFLMSYFLDGMVKNLGKLFQTLNISDLLLQVNRNCSYRKLWMSLKRLANNKTTITSMTYETAFFIAAH